MENNREIAIKISNVKKMYKLGQIGGGTLQADLQSWWARKRGKEDPNVKIGQEDRARLVGQTFMALNGIDLTIYKGEAVGIIGPNGAGKSTMLKLLSRVTAPTSGEIDIYGRITSMLEVGTGFNGEMTGRENVYLNGAILGMTKAEIDAKMEQIIEFSEVRDFIDTPVKRYSSGMYVKLAFSVAAHLDSEIMIMDEVLAVGDMAFQKKCLDKMRDAAKQEGRTVLYVSHNMNTIRRLCDRCIVLNKGQIIYDGEVEPAINIYMNSSKQMQIINTFGSKRERKDIDRSVQVKKLELINKKEYPLYYQGENIRLAVDINSNEKKSLFFRLTIHSFSGDRAGMATTHKSICVDRADNSCTISIPLEWLAPGKYSVDFVVYGINNYGAEQHYDIINVAFSFEKRINVDDNNKLEWNPSWWGYVMFPEIRIE